MEKVICERKKEFWNQEKFHDISFTFPESEKVLKANRMILALCSPVFEAMFFGSLANQDPVPIVDIDLDVFEAFLKYIYTDEFRVETLDEAKSLFYVAHKYEITTMEAVCEQFMIQNLKKFDLTDLIQFADMFSMANLIALCRLYLQHQPNSAVPAHWVKYKIGVPIPRGTYCVDFQPDGWPIAIGRVSHSGDLLPGTLDIKRMVLTVTYSGVAHEYTDNFEILCDGNLQWVQSKNGQIREKAVPGGRSNFVEELFIGKAKVDDKIFVGKIHPSHDCLYIPFHNAEHRRMDDYFILIDNNSQDKSDERKYKQRSFFNQPWRRN